MPLLFASGFATSRACSMKGCATGPSVRFVRVTIPIETRARGPMDKDDMMPVETAPPKPSPSVGRSRRFCARISVLKKAAKGKKLSLTEAYIWRISASKHPHKGP